MNEEVDDSDFYHQDFTTASDWEVFIARIEEIIHEWKLPYVKQGAPLTRNQLWENKWKTLTECINFADVQFTLTRYYLQIDDTSALTDVDEDDSKSQVLIDLMFAENDFCTVDETSPTVHPLARWYGIRDFLVLSPVLNTAIDNESKIKILLSSANIAVSNSRCEIPLFVKILVPSQHVYLGVSEMLGLRTNFDIIHLSKTPDRCKYLSGLLDVFKSKISSNILEPVTFSVRHCYSLQDWTSNVWTQQPPDFDILGVTFDYIFLYKILYLLLKPGCVFRVKVLDWKNWVLFHLVLLTILSQNYYCSVLGLNCQKMLLSIRKHIQILTQNK